MCPDEKPKLLTKTLTFGLGNPLGWDPRLKNCIPLTQKQRKATYTGLRATSRILAQVVNMLNAREYIRRVMKVSGIHKMHKRSCFEHEKEVRAVIYTREGLSGMPTDSGFLLPIDITVLVEKVYICPTAEQWLADLVKGETKRHGFDYEVLQSILCQKPP